MSSCGSLEERPRRLRDARRNFAAFFFTLEDGGDRSSGVLVVATVAIRPPPRTAAASAVPCKPAAAAQICELPRLRATGHARLLVAHAIAQGGVRARTPRRSGGAASALAQGGRASLGARHPRHIRRARGRLGPGGPRIAGGAANSARRASAVWSSGPRSRTASPIPPRTSSSRRSPFVARGDGAVAAGRAAGRRGVARRAAGGEEYEAFLDWAAQGDEARLREAADEAAAAAPRRAQLCERGALLHTADGWVVCNRGAAGDCALRLWAEGLPRPSMLLRERMATLLSAAMASPVAGRASAGARRSSRRRAASSCRARRAGRT